MSDAARHAAITDFEKTLAWVEQKFPQTVTSVQRELAATLTRAAAQQEVANAIDPLASAYSNRGW